MKTKRALKIILAVSAVIIAVAVRVPAATLSGASAEVREAYTYEDGRRYLSEPDSYFYALVTKNYLANKTLGDTVNDKGESWLGWSHYPEGRTADFQPGLVYLASGAYNTFGKLFGLELYSVNIWIAAFVMACSALLAFILGTRMSNAVGGFATAIFTTCAAPLVSKTIPGNFDTDMLTIFMNIALVLTFTEFMRAESLLKKILFGVMFSITVFMYYQCWNIYSFGFSLLVILGGLVYLITEILRTGKRSIKKRSENRQNLISYIVLFAVFVLTVFATSGFSFVKRLFGFMEDSSLKESGVMPNMMVSINELRVPALFTGGLKGLFLGYIHGERFTIMSAVGGLIPVILCIAGIIVMLIGLKKRNKEKSVYLFITTILLLACIFLSVRGARFLEYLSVASGIIAGACVGWISAEILKGRKLAVLRYIAIALICMASLGTTVYAAYRVSRGMRPSVSDSSADSMLWIKENAVSDDAVVASWWDIGYYYAYESEHPVLWDGGTQRPTRGILVSKAFTTENERVSKSIFNMLSVGGDSAANMLVEALGEKDGFAALWEILDTDRNGAVNILTEKYGMSAPKAGKIVVFSHPGGTREVYVVVTDKMLDRLGWIEFFANWDFDGKNHIPNKVSYKRMPDGSAEMGDDSSEVQEFFEKRANEMIWRLYFDGEGGAFFEKVFESADGLMKTQVWRIK